MSMVSQLNKKISRKTIFNVLEKTLRDCSPGDYSKKSIYDRIGNIQLFKTQYTAWTAIETFTTSQTIAVIYLCTFPHMLADIDTDRAIIGTDATLNTQFLFGDNQPDG
jgi:hypothetical protein